MCDYPRMFSCTFSLFFSLTKSPVFVWQVWLCCLSIRQVVFGRGKKNLQAVSAKICRYSLTSLISSSAWKMGACGFLMMRRSSPRSQNPSHRKRGLKAISEQTERFSRVSSSATWGVSLVNCSALRQNARSTHTAKLQEKRISCGTKKHSTPL